MSKVFRSLHSMHSIYAAPKVRPMSRDTIDVRYEQHWLKFKDKEVWPHQESPTLSLMQLAFDKGIRPQTTSNGQYYLFFIRDNDIPSFLMALSDNCSADFVRYVENKMKADKKDQICLKGGTLPHWF